MMLLLSFDLPRDTREERRQATKYRKRLVELGFWMKQYSLYEREVRSLTTRDHLIEILRNELPKTGSIVLYLLPDEVNDQQIEILGQNVARKTIRKPQIFVV